MPVFIVGILLLLPLTTRSENLAPRFELLHLWREDIEQHALAALSDPLIQRGVDWRDYGVKDNFYGVRTEFAERVAIGAPPGGVFWIGGPTLSELVADGTFRLIPNRVENTVFSEALLPEVYSKLNYQQGITALPVGIHLQNHIVYNSEIYNQLDLELPQTWKEFLTQAPLIQQAGFVPLSMSDQLWQLRFLFPSILMGYVDSNQMQELTTGPKDPASFRRPLMEALHDLDGLREFVNSDNYDLNWRESVEMVANRLAAANVLGDFSSPLYGEDGKFVCTLPPGNEYILWSFDTIALSVVEDPEQLAGQQEVIDVLSSAEYLENYISRKGGIPAYRSVDLKRINDCSRESMKIWRDTGVHVHLNSTGWSKGLNVVAEIVQRFWRTENQDVAEVAEEIIQSLRFLRDD